MMKDTKEIINPIEFDKKEVAMLILEQFENILDKNNITILGNYREGEESEARIYGKTFYQLENTIIDILTEYIEKRILEPMQQNNKIIFEQIKIMREDVEKIRGELEKRINLLQN